MGKSGRKTKNGIYMFFPPFIYYLRKIEKKKKKKKKKKYSKKINKFKISEYIIVF